VHLYLGLAAAIKLLREETLEGAYRRHAALSAAVKAGVQALGLELYGEDLERAVCVTAVKCPDGIDGDALTALIRSKYGIIFAPGQDKLKGKIFRIGHIGWFDVFDIAAALAAVELSLTELGADIERGVAVTRAFEAYEQRVTV